MKRSAFLIMNSRWRIYLYNMQLYTNQIEMVTILQNEIVIYYAVCGIRSADFLCIF